MIIATQEKKTLQEKIPILSTIYLYLMDSCNLNCIHCWINPSFAHEQPTKKHLSIPELKDIFEQAIELGLKRVKLTGGEPLLYPHFIELVEHLKEKKIAMSMETNGTLITENIANTINEAKFSHVAVSLDGAEAQTHEKIRRVKGSFRMAVDGAKRVASKKVPTQIIMAVYKDNIKEIESVARLAHDIGVNSLKLNYMHTLGRAKDLEKEGLLCEVNEIIECNRHVIETLSKLYKLKVMSNVPMVFKSLKDLRCGCGSCHIKNILGILADGKVSICGIGEEVEELIMGDATTTPLSEIWSNHPILSYIRTNIPDRLEGVCGRCIFKRRCLGSCVANTYVATGDFKNSFFLCKKAYEEGIFPQSRLTP